MYRATAMSALGSDDILDVVENMTGQRQSKRSHESFAVHWRKDAGLLYYEMRPDGRYRIMRNGTQASAGIFHTLAGARGKIASEASRAKREAV